MANIVVGLTPNSPPPAGITGIPHTLRTTAFDIIERLQDSLGQNPVNSSARDIRRAMLDAYREFGSIHRWNFLIALDRINLNGQFQQGTCSFLKSTGAVPNQLTIAGTLSDGVTPATWPSWALYGALRLPNAAVDPNTSVNNNSIVCLIKKAVSTTVLQLDDEFSPAGDLTAGSPFSIYRDTYTLPEDFVASDRGLVENNWGGMSYMRPHEWLTSIRYLESYGQPRLYTFRGDPKIPGRMALSVYPLPDQDQTLDFVYHRRMRAIKTFDWHTGTVTALLAAPTTVGISGASFTADHVGSVLRFANNQKTPPTGLEGESPFAIERNILEVVSAAQARIDTPVDADYQGVAYRLSDPIDLEDVAMLNAFVACAYKFLARVRRFKPAEQGKLQEDFAYQLALAKEADDRDMSRRAVELFGTYPYRMRDMPRGPDIS